MTKFLNSDGLTRLVALIKQALGDKKDADVVVTVTKSGNTYSSDKTYAQIVAANSAGKTVVLVYSTWIYSLTRIANNQAEFDCILGEIGLLESFFITSSGSVLHSSFNIQAALTYDHLPTQGSTNPVWSGGVYYSLGQKQDTLVSGTNIKTVNTTSLLGSGNVNLDGSNLLYTGDDGTYFGQDDFINDALYNLDEAINDLNIPSHIVVNEDPTGGSQTIANPELLNKIESISTTQSTASGGTNTVTITETNGTSTSFNVLNGINGGSLGDVDIVDVTGDRTDAVMSQKGVTEYGRRVAAGDLAGTSDWIKAKLTALGWEFGKYIATNGNLVSNASYCVSHFIPMSDFKEHSVTFRYMFNAFNSGCFSWYDSNKAFLTGLYYTTNTNNSRTITFGSSSSWDNAEYVRITLNPNKLSECSIFDNTDNETIFSAKRYIENLCLELLSNCGDLKQNFGDSTVSAMSQNAITENVLTDIIYDQSNMEFEMGDFDASGNLESTSYARTKFLDISNATEVVLENSSNSKIALYDKQKNKIFYNANTATGTIFRREIYPDMAYIRLCTYTNALNHAKVILPYYKIVAKKQALKENIAQLEDYKKYKEDNVGDYAFNAFNVFNTSNTYHAKSKISYDLSVEPIIDVVCYEVVIGAGSTGLFFGFSDGVRKDKSYNFTNQNSNYIGFVSNTWKCNFIVRRNGTTLFTQDVGDFAYNYPIKGARFDFRHKKVTVMKRKYTGELETVEVDLSGYDLNIGKAYMYTGLGYCGYCADYYVGYNTPLNALDFSAFFKTPIEVGKFKKFADIPTTINDYDGRRVGGGFTSGTMSNYTNPTQIDVGHYSAEINTSTFTRFNISCNLSNLYDVYFGSTNFLARWKIKPMGSDLEAKNQNYMTIRDMYDITDSVFIEPIDSVYIIPNGHTVEVRASLVTNGLTSSNVGFRGSCTIEMWDWECFGVMNANLTPSNYDGKTIYSGIPFEYPYPDSVVGLALVSNSNYYAQGYMKYSSNKIYVRVYDTSTNTYIDKQISNT